MAEPVRERGHGARTPAVVAIDIGGTALKGALVDAHAVALARRDVPTPVGRGGAAVTAAVVDLAGWLAAASPTASVVGAAAVTPGRIADGVVRYAANLGWRDVPLAALLAARLGVPTAVDHDASAAVLAESTLAGWGDDCLLVALGTGVGAGYARGGVVLAGVTGTAREIGHIPVYPDGEHCRCGQRGCLEAYASAAGLARRYQAAGRHGDAADIVARLGHDPAADRIWDEAVAALALALTTATLLIDPGVIVLGGGLSGAGARLLDPLRARLFARLTWRPPPRVELSVLGNDAGWRGASLRAWQAARDDPATSAASGSAGAASGSAGTGPADLSGHVQRGAR